MSHYQDDIAGIGIKIQGHLKINEYKNQQDYVAGRKKQILNKRNAIHKDDAVIMIGKTMTDRANDHIAYMVFGNGGTTLSGSGNIIFNEPNVLGRNTDLYNPVFFQLVDDMSGALPGNQMAVRHIANSMFADIDIRCLINVNQPFGQLSSNTFSLENNQPYITTPTNFGSFRSQFSFDEIGLKLADGTLITHVIFSPVLKTASSILEVIYTLRIAVGVAQQSLDIMLFGEEVISVVADFQFPKCIQNFNWSSYYVNTNSLSLSGESTNQLDQYGNFYVNASKTLVFNPFGIVISAMNCTDLANAVDAWFGSPIVQRGLGFSPTSGFTATPILQGQYILAYFNAQGGTIFSRWFVILEPSATGNPTVLGAYFWATLVGAPYGGYTVLGLGLANNQTINDPILFRAYQFLGGTTCVIAMLPSISAFITGTYRLGWPSLSDCQIPLAYFYPIGNANFSNKLLIAGSPNSLSGFTMPDSSGGTNLYLYLNRDYMDSQIGSSIITNAEVHNVIQPAYPLGAMIKVSMGHIDYVTAASTAFVSGGHIGATSMYSVDNAHWVNSSAVSQIPFTDEYTYLSLGNTPGGADCYIMQPGGVINRGGGLWWVIFYLPGDGDARINTHGTLWETIRVFQYDQSTQIATQILLKTCVSYTNIQITSGGGAIKDYSQTISITGSDLLTLHIRGYRLDVVPPNAVYSTDFLTFTPVL